MTPEQIIERVAADYGIPPDRMMPPEGYYCPPWEARSVAALLIRARLHLSYSEIAPLFGLRSHSALVQGVKRLELNLPAKKGLRQRVERLRAAIQRDEPHSVSGANAI